MINNKIPQITNTIMTYPKLLIESIRNNENTEQFMFFAYNITVLFVVLLMTFALISILLVLTKISWIIFRSICFWFFGRDKLKECLVKNNIEQRALIEERFDEIKNMLKKK